MIFDTIENATQYAAVNSRINTAIEYMKQITDENYPTGKLELDGDNVYLVFGNYETRDKDDALMEAHKKYIDIMYMVEGSETIYIKPTSALKHITQEYDEKTEALFAEMDSDVTAVTLEKGCFVVLFPQDAHAPACHADRAKNVKKIIGKVRL